MAQYAHVKFASESQEPLNYSGQLDRKLVQICDVQDGITIDPFNILLVVTDCSSYKQQAFPLILLLDTAQIFLRSGTAVA